MRKPVVGFFTRYDISRLVQSRKMAAALKFWILEVEGLYYLNSENKRTDQLQGYNETDLHLCFLVC